MDEPAEDGVAEPSNDGAVEPSNDDAVEPSKGGRPRRWNPEIKVKRVGAKLPLDLAAAFEAKAAERGMSMQDYLGWLAAEITGVPYEVEVPQNAA